MAGNRCTVEGRGDVTLWDLSTGKLKSTVRPGDGAYLFSPDSKRLIFEGDPGWSPRKRRLVVWDILREKAERMIENGRLPAHLNVAALSPDGQHFA
jgi:hypothetical protein